MYAHANMAFDDELGVTMLYMMHEFNDTVNVLVHIILECRQFKRFNDTVNVLVHIILECW